MGSMIQDCDKEWSGSWEEVDKGKMKMGSSDGKILERWHQPSELLENNEIYLLWYACATAL